METQGKKRHWATGAVIAGIVDELIVRADMQAVGNRVFVIGFENALPGIGQGAVAEDEAGASGGEIIRMRGRNSVEYTAPDLIFLSPPRSPLI